VSQLGRPVERESSIRLLSGNVRIEDLLGRAPLILDRTAGRADLHQRVILLTGAAGSVGSELARQIAAVGPARLVLLDQSESDLYFIYLELSASHPGLELVPVICDVTNQSRLAQVYAQYRPNTSFTPPRTSTCP
jgi:FlaA1/EpsC-like NDP-sugar epimerase